MPFYTAWINCFRCGLCAVWFWTSLTLCIMIYGSKFKMDAVGHIKYYSNELQVTFMVPFFWGGGDDAR